MNACRVLALLVSVPVISSTSNPHHSVPHSSPHLPQWHERASLIGKSASADDAAVAADAAVSPDQHTRGAESTAGPALDIRVESEHLKPAAAERLPSERMIRKPEAHAERGESGPRPGLYVVEVGESGNNRRERERPSRPSGRRELIRTEARIDLDAAEARGQLPQWVDRIDRVEVDVHGNAASADLDQDPEHVLAEDVHDGEEEHVEDAGYGRRRRTRRRRHDLEVKVRQAAAAKKAAQAAQAQAKIDADAAAAKAAEDKKKLEDQLAEEKAKAEAEKKKAAAEAAAKAKAEKEAKEAKAAKEKAEAEAAAEAKKKKDEEAAAKMKALSANSLAASSQPRLPALMSALVLLSAVACSL